MKGSRLAPRYAKSLLDFAIEKGNLEGVFADMKLIANTCKHSRELSLLLNNPVINSGKKIDVLNALFSVKCTSLSMTFIQVIVKKKREAFLKEIASSFIRQYKTYKNILTAEVTTASGLDEELREKVYEIIRRSSDAEIELVEKTERSIIGGIILRVGDKCVDASIRKKIIALHREFRENLYVGILDRRQ